MEQNKCFGCENRSPKALVSVECYPNHKDKKFWAVRQIYVCKPCLHGWLSPWYMGEGASNWDYRIEITWLEGQKSFNVMPK